MLSLIADSLIQYKQRAVFTGLSICWGVFILVVLIGLGNGFEKGVLSLFDAFTNNAVWITFNKTSLDYKGLPTGRLIRLSPYDLSMLRSNINEIESISPESTLGRGSFVTFYDKKGWFDLKAVTVDYFGIKRLAAESGRTLNNRDILERRKVVLIGKSVSERFFSSFNDAVGKKIKIDSELFTVVGVIEDNFTTMTEGRNMYIPYSTFEVVYGSLDQISSLALSIKSKEANHKSIEERIRALLARRYDFKQDDKEVLYYLSLKSQMDVFELLFSTINIFLWFIGLSALLSGIISVSNMMFMVVRERTKEIGLRKAVGARPSHILRHFIGESIVITGMAGFAGMFLGMLCLGGMEWAVDDEDLISKFQISIPIAISATLLIVCAGTLAGFLPARSASKIDPIEALRQE